MGIGGLVGWARKAHPEAFTSYPKRWAAPEIRGKRVAIDATLMTNRFHFASSGEEDMRGKGAIVGWYNLISLMRRHKVQPIAIWDKPGKRSWKELETRKRLFTRAQHLARRSHEESRLVRLHALRDAMADFQELSREEQECVQDHWVATRFIGSSDSMSAAGQALPLVSAPSQSSPSPSKEAETEETSPLENVTSTIDTFSDILRTYRRHVQSTSGKGVQPNDPTLEHIRELEDLEEELGPASAPPPDPSSELDDQESMRDEGRRVVDEEIEQTLGSEDFPESRTQLEMTMEEGEIIISILTPPTSPISPSRLPSTVEPPPAVRLDTLIARQPVVKAVYDRALSSPSAITHAECRELLERMGVPVLLAESPFEAEGLASALAREGRVDFVGTEDSDVVAYEAPLLKNVTSSKLPLLLLSPTRLRVGTALSDEAFLDFCVLCGTDASPRIPGIGPAKALKLLKTYGGIEAILEHEEGVREKVESMEGGVGTWMEMAKNARQLFRSIPPVKPGISESKTAGLSEEEMERWLEVRHGIALVERSAEGEGEAVVVEVAEEETDTVELPMGTLHIADETVEELDHEQEDLYGAEGAPVMSEEDWKDVEEAFKSPGRSSR